jgi:putative hemin transport protein
MSTKSPIPAKDSAADAATLSPSALADAWRAYREAHPRAYPRQAALDLGVSEAELLNTRMDGSVRRLLPDWTGILSRASSLGKAMALTRNDDVVHERKGVYPKFMAHGGKVGLFVSKDIDLRLFLDAWAFGFAVVDEGPRGIRRSLQFFDPTGTAVHKIYAATDAAEAFEALAEVFADPAKPVGAHSLHQDEAWNAAWNGETVPDAEAAGDLEAFREEWRNLKDTHDFHGLVKRYGLRRTEALAAAPEGYAERLDTGSLRLLLECARDRQVPIMVFVGNPGCIQIHTGPVRELKAIPEWYNVLDPDFQLHLRESGLAEAWWVRKPTEDGDVHALEAFDAKGRALISCFGVRKPGIPEREDWRGVLEQVRQASVTALSEHARHG